MDSELLQLQINSLNAQTALIDKQRKMQDKQIAARLSFLQEQLAKAKAAEAAPVEDVKA